MRVIMVTRLDGSEFVINADLIETVEATPDTVITFAKDKKVVVRESPEEIIDSVVEYRHRIYVDPNSMLRSTDKRPTAEQMNYAHKGTGAHTKRFRVVPKDDQPES